MIVAFLSPFALRMSAVEPNFVNFAIFGKQFEKLVEEILVVVIDHKREFGLICKWSARHFARNYAHCVFAKVPV